MTEHLNAEEIKAFQALLSKDEGRSEMVQLFKTEYYYAIDTARTTMCRRLNELYWNGAVCDFSSVEKAACTSYCEGRKSRKTRLVFAGRSSCVRPL